ncbi:MAG: DNA-binding response regulator [Chthoniobacteraceae bacterium]|nr:DNA-binding response regulator [Chthoniobacteraceae bacterium]
MTRPAIQLFIVDDEPSLRTAYARLARSAKMEPRAFGSVEEFMEAELSDDKACVICDGRMLGKSGLELPELLARAGRHLPVIFVTAHDTPEARAIAHRVGAAGYFSKPVDDQALLDAVAWALSGLADSTQCDP